MSVLLTATARHSGPCPAGFHAGARAWLEQYALPFRISGDELCLDLPKGRSRFRTAADGLSVHVEASDEVARHHMCEGALYLLAQVFPEAAEALVWEGIEQRGGLPPGTHLARLAGVERLSPHFLRVTLECAGTAQMMEGGLHFSLLIPPEGRAPVWPVLNARGRAEWPKGEDQLHRAAFTFVARDPIRGCFSFDLYEHAGGPSTQWAKTAAPGALIGISGPGGGELPPEGPILIAGDETALPAIRQILAASAPDRRGLALIETGCAEDRLLGVVPEGIDIRWLDRSRGDTLEAALETVALPAAPADLVLWVAAEQGVVRRARQRFLTELGVNRRSSYLAGYWSA